MPRTSKGDPILAAYARGCPSAESASKAAAKPAAGQKIVNVYNWSDYIDPAALEQFTKETGIEVRYDVFDSNEVLETKLLAGRTGYDVVVPSGSFLERQIRADVFRSLDRSQLPNLRHLDAGMQSLAAGHDPGNAHGVIYMWGTTGIGYNAGKVRAIDPNAPVNSWALVFDPKQAAKYRDCGISLLDAPSEMVKAALAWKGRDPNSQNADDLKLAEDVLMSIRPYVRMIHSSNYIDALARGEICVAVGWSGDMLQARDLASEAGDGVVVEYAVPKEGSIAWFDLLAIPADAPHPEAAHAFINYLLEPEVAARNANYVNYATGNGTAFALLTGP